MEGHIKTTSLGSEELKRAACSVCDNSSYDEGAAPASDCENLFFRIEIIS